MSWAENVISLLADVELASNLLLPLPLPPPRIRIPRPPRALLEAAADPRIARVATGDFIAQAGASVGAHFLDSPEDVLFVLSFINYFRLALARLSNV